jgi:NAD(P)-dependent dehydrogenase (short-subunit alcohol dehydrogenase family)
MPDLFSLAGRTALVTGAGSGLGREFALGLADAGADAICIDRERAWVEETVGLIAQSGGRACALVADVADQSAVDQVAAAVAKSHGALHVLVNNAGVAPFPNRAHETDIDDWKRVLDINLTGAFLVTRALLPLMLKAGGGSIINIASMIGLVGFYPDFSVSGVAYAASKAGLIGFTRQLAVEYAKDKIRVNAIAPGWHGGTRLAAHVKGAWGANMNERFEGAILDGTPMGRRGLPKELQGLVVFLASDASSYMTGQVVGHDGGWTVT